MDALHTADNLTFCTPSKEAALDALWSVLILIGWRLKSRFPPFFLMESVWYCRRNPRQGERGGGSSLDSVPRRWCVTLDKLLATSPRLNFPVCKMRELNWIIFSELDKSFLVWILRLSALHCPTTMVTYLLCNCVKVKWSCSVVSYSLRPHGLTVAYQAPLSMGFSRQEYWSGLPFPSPGDLPNPGIEPGSPTL